MSKAPKKDTEAQVLKEQLVRALADYDNFRKRTAERAEQERFILTARVVGKFLPILDMLYEAQMHLNDSGLALTIKELEEILKAEGIEAIFPVEGDEFTEDLHEVIEVVSKGGLQDNKVVECVLRGWKFRDGQVIRHAKVKVNKKGE